MLHRYNLEKPFKKNPDATLEKLQTIACTDDRRDVLYALTELSYLERRSPEPERQTGRTAAGAQQLLCLGHLRLSVSVR